MNYFILDPQGTQLGPLTPQQLKEHKINKHTMAWCEGMSQWQPSGSIAELKPYLQNPLFSLPVLLAYAVLMSVLFSLLSIFIYGFAGSLFNTCPQYAPIAILVISVLVPLFFVLKKFRRNLKLIIFLMIPFMFSSVFAIIYFMNTGYYNNGYCNIYRNGKDGILNKYGLLHLPCIYRDLSPVDAKGNYCSFYDSYRIIAEKDKCGLIDFTGSEVLPFDYDEIDTWRGGETDVLLLRVKKDNLNGLYTLDGEEVLECKYSYFFDYEEEKYKTSLVNIGGTDDGDYITGGKWGLIDRNGHILVPCEYKKVSTYSSLGYIKGINGDEIDYYDFEGNYLRTEYD